MNDLVVLVPVLGRPHRVAPLLESIESTTPGARVVFLADPEDQAELDALAEVCPHRAQRYRVGGGYAAKINYGVARSEEPLVFLAADDLHFHPGWFETARARLRDGVEVVGVNDLLVRSREHATHFLITRAYAERATIDGQPGPLFEGYAHWFCDNELIETARARGAYAYCAEAVVEHLHPMGGKAPDDDTYRLGTANRYADSVLFRKRRHLWT